MNKERFLELCRTNPEEVYNHFMILGKAIADLTAHVEALQVKVDTLQEENRELRARLNKNSSNSSKPPSSEEFVKTKSPRKKSGKKSGGQKGHEGHTYKMSSTPDRVIIHRAQVCMCCGYSLEGQEAESDERRQVHDIPPPKPEVTEHICETLACKLCGTVNKASFPENVTQPFQYGENLIATIVYLNQYQFIPYKRIVEHFEVLYGIKISEATVYNAITVMNEKLAPAEEAIIAALLASEVLNLDETGLRIEAKRQWLHVASNDKYTHYKWHPKRGSEATDAIGILPQFDGLAVHDYWKPYYKYCFEHSLCNAHNIRELTAITELTGQQWPQDMIDLLLEIKNTVDGLNGELSTKDKKAYEKRYQDILEIGFRANPPPVSVKKRGRPKQGKARNMLNRLLNHQGEVLAFMEGSPEIFDNNQAERDLRMMKVKQKISGVFRSAKGADMFCRIRGYISTSRKHSVSAFAALKSALQGKPFIPEY